MEQNHCARIIEDFMNLAFPQMKYIVFYFSDIYPTTYFGTVNSVLDFMHQILEVCPLWINLYLATS